MITATRKNNLAASLNFRSGDVVIGTPTAQGGDDEGPTPHELLEASLAACTVITLQMYANRKCWNLISSQVLVNIVSENIITRMLVEIKLEGDLSDEQKKRLFEIAKKCPIHKVLDNKIEIEMELL